VGRNVCLLVLPKNYNIIEFSKLLRAHAQVCVDITLIEPVMFLLQWIKTHVSFILGLVVTKRKRAATVHRRG